jgi:hypothetical protein
MELVVACSEQRLSGQATQTSSEFIRFVHLGSKTPGTQFHSKTLTIAALHHQQAFDPKTKVALSVFALLSKPFFSRTLLKCHPPILTSVPLPATLLAMFRCLNPENRHGPTETI